MRSVVVAAAAVASAGTGASWSPKWSGMNRVANPRSSTRWARSVQLLASVAELACRPKRKGRGCVMSGSLGEEEHEGHRVSIGVSADPRLDEGDFYGRRPSNTTARPGRDGRPPV